MRKRLTKQRPSLDEILQTLRQHLPDLQTRYAVKSLGVFGSYVRGEQTPKSDVDILVEFQDARKPGLFGFVRMEQELSDLLGAKVDLVEKASLKPYIGRHILHEVVYVSDAAGAPPTPGGSLRPRRKREIRDYLKDMLDNIERVQQFVQGRDLAAFSADWQSVYAALYALEIIGEAARRVPAPLRQRYPEVPWRSIVGLRNVVAHEYFAVNLPRIWDVMQQDLPRLRVVVTRMWQEIAEEGDA